MRTSRRYASCLPNQSHRSQSTAEKSYASHNPPIALRPVRFVRHVVFWDNARRIGIVILGDKVPTFEVSDDQGKPWKSSEHFGKKIVVVYFYPADMTGGCTAQACAFRDDLGKLAGKDVAVVRRR